MDDLQAFVTMLEKEGGYYLGVISRIEVCEGKIDEWLDLHYLLPEGYEKKCQSLSQSESSVDQPSGPSR